MLLLVTDVQTTATMKMNEASLSLPRSPIAVLTRNGRAAVPKHPLTLAHSAWSSPADHAGEGMTSERPASRSPLDRLLSMLAPDL